MSIIKANKYNEARLEFVNVTEFCKPKTVQKKFTDEEIRIIQTEFNDKFELVHTRDGGHAITVPICYYIQANLLLHYLELYPVLALYPF